ncbi:MAG: MarR family winged helix-turn-helix transcriptional regulator [Rickettsiales bacterium]|nr:MarR family winged helix-turn-helix transcriptional regulator [Rickettsiales bacterium]
MQHPKATYQESILLIERLHRQFLDVIKNHLETLKIDDINNVQTLILYNIGDDQLTIGELTHRGYYLGSNVSYNVKKLVESDYLVQEQAVHDKRSSKVRLSDKGLKLCEKIEAFYDKTSLDFVARRVNEERLKETNLTLIQLESFWANCIIEMKRIF